MGPEKVSKLLQVTQQVLVLLPPALLPKVYLNNFSAHGQRALNLSKETLPSLCHSSLGTMLCPPPNPAPKQTPAESDTSSVGPQLGIAKQQSGLVQGLLAILDNPALALGPLWLLVMVGAPVSMWCMD